jgi:hypothetical protein
VHCTDMKESEVIRNKKKNFFLAVVGLQTSPALIGYRVKGITQGKTKLDGNGIVCLFLPRQPHSGPEPPNSRDS